MSVMAGRELARILGPLGVWSMQLRGADRPVVQDAAAELNELGLRALWIPGLDGKGVLEDTENLLRAAPETTVALGVLGIWGTPAEKVAHEVARLDRLHGPRTVVGLGISDPGSARGHGHQFGRPVVSMTRYLDDLDAAPTPLPADRRLLGALGPRMATLGAARTAGTHPFLVTPRYTARLRAALGPSPLIAPHQAVVLDSDPDRARATARAGVGMFVGLPAYRNNLRRLGFDDDDLVPGGSDRLIDAVVARGDVDSIQARVRAHLDAGADHVAVHVLGSDDLPQATWRELATFLPSLAEA
ncbi:TIGR03620 family F420-dependent LLM class oxidoreductase [Promicromonospora sp. MEB111]|uniref:TIGR03620 family F420-dependent LLM class oxidoreductase n=1 Tax=Promicromonospora sp. MEB111 TaxID=3040301 RepID=UPI002550D2A1|nr:TIGR03620 family F420-dependent LLM class oxidoreductase [Promicromonospora sp. MEB111]